MNQYIPNFRRITPLLHSVFGPDQVEACDVPGVTPNRSLFPGKLAGKPFRHKLAESPPFSYISYALCERAQSCVRERRTRFENT